MSVVEGQSAEYYPIYVAGKFTSTAQHLDVVSPYSGQCVYRTCLAGDAEFEEAVSAACAVRRTLRDLPVYRRWQILMEVSEALHDQRQELALIMAREAAKPLKTALGEVDRAVQTFLIAAEEARRLPGELLSIDWTEAGANKDAVVKYFPVGLVAGISPFNFPLNLVAHKIAPAIAAGCPMILKPASKTPISALRLAQIIDRTVLPKGALSILPMDRTTGNRLVTDERFALLSFTGSPAVGWQMKQQSGRKKIVLELGGNAGLIIDRDADIGSAAAKAVPGAFAFAGQSCIHTQRIIVHDAVFDAFMERFTGKLAGMKIGDPEQPDTDFSVLIDHDNARRIELWVEEARQQGATIVAGGTREGGLYAPTVLTNTSREMKVCSREAFAPIVVIERYHDFREAVAAINDSDFGLQAGVFTYDYRRIHYAFRNLEVGGVLINEVPTFRADHMPYGGIKDSGLGREGPKYAIQDMLEARVMVIDHGTVNKF